MILYQITHQKDISQLAVISSLDYLDAVFGQEIENFNVTNPMVQEIEDYLPGYQIKEGSGLFRKPYPFIHFENFKVLDEWVVVYCLEPFTFSTYSQEDISFVFDAKDMEETLKGEWEKDTELKVKAGQILIFRPWLFHSISEGIGHYFFMELKE